MRRIILSAAALLALGGCFEKKSESPSSAYAEAKETHARLVGDDKGAAGANPVCRLFTAR